MKQIYRKFARSFPSHHPRKGDSTFFMEKIFNCVGLPPVEFLEQFIWPQGYLEQIEHLDTKGHTIRGGKHFKKGDFIIPSVWSGRPYNSSPIQFAPPVEIVNTWGFSINEHGYAIEDYLLSTKDLKEVAKNDGLDVDDFECWFKLKKGEVFDGQIICWDKKIQY